MKQLIESRILRLNEEKMNLLYFIDSRSSYDEEYITTRICYINERIRELQDLLDDIKLMEMENEK